MRQATATELKNRLGQYLRQAETEPVIIEVSRRPTAVIISHAEYERLTRMEDEYWSSLAREAEKSGYVGADESMRVLQEALKEK